MRVNPILGWGYAEVWEFLRHFSLPYCSLYEVGYTSLGKRSDTAPNPALLKPDGSYAPAWELSEELLERAGRDAKLKLPLHPAEAAAARGEPIEARTAALLVIGDEILWEDARRRTATRRRARSRRGVTLRRVAVVADRLGEISTELEDGRRVRYRDDERRPRADARRHHRARDGGGAAAAVRAERSNGGDHPHEARRHGAGRGRHEDEHLAARRAAPPAAECGGVVAHPAVRERLRPPGRPPPLPLEGARRRPTRSSSAHTPTPHLSHLPPPFPPLHSSASSASTSSAAPLPPPSASSSSASRSSRSSPR